jgi:hypothetical protein
VGIGHRAIQAAQRAAVVFAAIAFKVMQQKITSAEYCVQHVARHFTPEHGYSVENLGYAVLRDVA